jgi:soluble lytic murein transglycosylase-like protein
MNHRTAILMAFFSALWLTCAAFAGDSIVPVIAADGRKIFVNQSDVPHPNPTAKQKNAARSEGPAVGATRYVYWSNTAHRWKPVPMQGPVGQRARSAAAEVLAATGTPTPATDAGTAADSSDASTFFSSQKVNEAVEQAAARHNVDANLVRAMIKVESNFNPRALSRKGAMGLMQLMPATARSLNVAHPFDPTENIEAGVRHLRQLLDNFGGDLGLSLAAYNAGAKAVQLHNGIPPYRETQQYVRQITSLYRGGNVLGGPDRIPIRVSRDAEGHLMFSNTE